MQLDAIPLIEKLFCEVNPIPVKKALNLMGWQAGPLRMPLTEMTEAHTAQLAKELEALELNWHNKGSDYREKGTDWSIHQFLLCYTGICEKIHKKMEITRRNTKWLRQLCMDVTENGTGDLGTCKGG